MLNYKIPFNKASIMGNEYEYMRQAITNFHISGDGPFSKKCHAWLEGYLGSAKSLLTTSCTHALEMAALLVDIKPGDEVICPCFTFVSTINAFVIRGAKPVFIDIRPDTLNIDEDQLEGLITEKTKAILVVHYAGVGCEMDKIMEVSNKHNIPVIEDNAHGLFGRYREQLLGTFGSLSTQSFHETKNITCGEGGALLINNPQYIERAEILREKGTNRSRFFRGQIDKYTWVDVGSSYLPSDILAAFLFAQLEAYTQIQALRKDVWEIYNRELKNWAQNNDVRLPFIPAHCEQPYHMFYIVTPSLAFREGLISHLKEHGILAVFHYLPLHISEMGVKYGGQPGDYPVTEIISDRLLRLPFFNSLSRAEQNYIISTMNEFYFKTN